MPLFKILFSLFLLCITACSTVKPSNKNNWVGYTQSGIASYYGDKHQNKKTANGELYQHALKTAAHKKLPFGTQVKVTNTNNGKSVLVKINDRGPFVRGRIIDLSKSAFNDIGNTSQGIVTVNIEVVD